jgi:hypothetical protein
MAENFSPLLPLHRGAPKKNPRDDSRRHPLS